MDAAFLLVLGLSGGSRHAHHWWLPQGPRRDVGRGCAVAVVDSDTAP
jgi:hypothetical protein